MGAGQSAPELPIAAASSGSGPLGILGGSGVQVEGNSPFKTSTPFGDVLLSHLDGKHRAVIFANRHLCTSIDQSSGEATYAPPHEVNYQALIWALCVKCECSEVIALGSAGTLHPDVIPVGSVVMPDDYYMVKPEPCTFWGQPGIGTFATPEQDGRGRIHYTPANPLDQKFVQLRFRVQAALNPLLATLPPGKVRLAKGQNKSLWPCVHSVNPGTRANDSTVYVNTIGPRFETRAEIRAYMPLGHVVGMTCAREWALCEELEVPYSLVCVCDNACNGLSKHPQGALQEYLEHKQAISEVTGAVIMRLVEEFGGGRDG